MTPHGNPDVLNWNPNGSLKAEFYKVAVGPEEYEVEAFSEEHAWARAMEAYRQKLAAEGLTLVVTKLP